MRLFCMPKKILTIRVRYDILHPPSPPPNIRTPNCIHVTRNGYDISWHVDRGEVRYVRTYLAFCDATSETLLNISTGTIGDSHP
jgi:hypothetical protein